MTTRFADAVTVTPGSTLTITVAGHTITHQVGPGENRVWVQVDEQLPSMDTAAGPPEIGRPALTQNPPPSPATEGARVRKPT